MSFKRHSCCILDSSGDLVCKIVRVGRLFKGDFSYSSSSDLQCLVSSGSKDLFHWHRRLGHIGFDHLARISNLNLVRGLPDLKIEKSMNLVCSPCRHGKMVSASHPPLSLVMTDAPCQLLHMDTVGPARVQSAGGKWYVLVIVDDYSRYSWVFLMTTEIGG